MNFRTLQIRYCFLVFALMALFLGASVNVAQAVTLNPAGGAVAVSVEQGASKHVTLATIINDGSPATFNVTAVSENASWLTVDASTATAVSSFLLSGTVNASGLAVGTYNESVIVETNDGFVVVAITLTVNKSMSLGVVTAYPSSVSLTAIEGGESSSFNVVLYGSASFTYGVGTDRNWLSVEEGTGGSDQKNTYTQTIKVSPGSLEAGSYTGTVYFTFSDGQTRSVAVNLTVLSDPMNSTTFIPAGAISIDAGVGQSRVISGLLVGQQAFDWQANSDSTWLSAQPISGSGSSIYAIDIVANAAGLYSRSEPYVGKLTIVTTLGSVHEITVALSVTDNPSTWEPVTDLTYNTSSWLNLQQNLNTANLSGRLFVIMEHPQLVPYQQYAYHIGPYGPQLDLFSKWGRTVPNVLDLAYASDVKTVSKVVIGGYRMSGLEGNLVVKLMVGNNVNNLSEIKRWNIEIIPLEGEWTVTDRFDGEWVPYTKPLILDEKRMAFNAYWGGLPLAVSYGDPSTQLGSNFRICGAGSEMFCFDGPDSGEGDSSYIINLQTQMAEIQHRVEWYEPTSIQGKWSYRWWGYDAWSPEQPFVALRTDQDISEFINSSTMPGARGELEIGLHWTNYNDLDLHVTDPSGEEVYYAHSVSVSGGQLDVDSNAACSGNSTNDAWEHIVWVTNPPAGEYKVQVNYFKHCDNAPQSSVFAVIVKNGTEETTYDGAVSNEGDTIDVATITVQ